MYTRRKLSRTDDGRCLVKGRKISEISAIESKLRCTIGGFHSFDILLHFERMDKTQKLRLKLVPSIAQPVPKDFR